MAINSLKPSAENIYELQSIIVEGQEEGKNPKKSQNIASMNIEGKGGSQNKSDGVSEQSLHKTNPFVYFYVLFFGIFSYFYTSAKWIIKTDDEYYD